MKVCKRARTDVDLCFLRVSVPRGRVLSMFLRLARPVGDSHAEGLVGGHCCVVIGSKSPDPNYQVHSRKTTEVTFGCSNGKVV